MTELELLRWPLATIVCVGFVVSGWLLSLRWFTATRPTDDMLVEQLKITQANVLECKQRLKPLEEHVSTQQSRAAVQAASERPVNFAVPRR